jgi:signal peptidase
MLSKGDNNQGDDRGLYPTNQIWLNREHIIGKIRAYMPFVGYLTILINDYPILKYLMMGLMIFSVMINKEKEKV